MTTAERQDWPIVGYTAKGRAVYEIAGAEGEGDKPDPKPDDPPAFQAPKDQAEFDRMVARRIERERAKFADYDELKAKASKLDQLEQSQKSEIEQATEARTAAEKKAADAELRALRLEVAADKGLTTAQAKRLQGSTKDELEADADELLATFAPVDGKDGSKDTPPSPRPIERVSGGGDPSDQPAETDPRKLAEQIPRH